METQVKDSHKLVTDALKAGRNDVTPADKKTARALDAGVTKDATMFRAGQKTYNDSVSPERIKSRRRDASQSL